MKSIYLTLALLLFPYLLSAQPVINNAEDFSEGTILKFIQCNSTKISEGKEGRNQLWDFSDLVSTNDTITEWIESPENTTNGKDYPKANLVEKYSDGKEIFFKKTKSGTYLLGYVSPSVTINYSDSCLIATRPITYLKTISDSFNVNYSSMGYKEEGKGITTITADGYGTLVLPNGQFKNVLRIKIEQIVNATVTGTNYSTTIHSITFAWFDGIHTSALLKISSTKSTGYNQNKVEYLISETTNK